MAERAPTIEESFGLCTYCPSLCRHACPVATAEASDTVSPWGLMSLAGHVRAGKVAADADIMHTLGACNGCGACTEACMLHVPVMEALVAMRQQALEEAPALRGHVATRAPYEPGAFSGLGARSRYEERPAVSLVPGPGALPDAVQMLLSLCDRLDVDALACGELARLDHGYDYWLAGDHAAFLELAKRAHAASAGSRDIVVMSAETLFLFKVVYPRFGLHFSAEVLHVSEMLLPVLSGAVVRRLTGRIGYHESCHLARHL